MLWGTKKFMWLVYCDSPFIVVVRNKPVWSPRYACVLEFVSEILSFYIFPLCVLHPSVF